MPKIIKQQQHTFRLGELFSGPGGIALAAINSEVSSESGVYSIAHEWANDYDRDTCQTYRSNICPDKPESVICKDIRELELSKLSPIDAFAFGFPCNDFSVVGERKGMDGVYGPLYSFGVQCLVRFQPKWFVAENVGGLKTSGEGNAFAKILHDLIHAGYRVVPHLYKFEEYGVPQARRRILIVGIRNDLDVVFRVPAPTTLTPITAREAIENPPIPVDAPNQELTRQSQQVVDRLKHIKPGQNAFNSVLPSHLRLNVAGATISQIYKRLDPNKPAYTITGSGGGGTHVYHWKEDRALTNRERARLQAFPDDFEFSGSKESVRKQIGMAVPPAGVKVILEAILKSFARIPYPSVKQNLAIPVSSPLFEPITEFIDA